MQQMALFLLVAVEIGGQNMSKHWAVGILLLSTDTKQLLATFVMGRL